jgi:hypothetical protein
MPTDIRVDIIDSSRRIVHVDGADLPFRVDFPDGEPRIDDIAYATWLGYENPVNIRKLIKRMLRAGKLSRDAVFSTVEKTPRGGRPSEAYSLPRIEALLVATQSETPRAWKMTTTIVAVFDAVMSGKLAMDLDAVRRVQREEMEREFQTRESRLREIRKHVGLLTDAIATMPGAEPRDVVTARLSQLVPMLCGVAGVQLGGIEGTDFHRVLGALGQLAHFFGAIPVRRKPKSVKRGLPAPSGQRALEFIVPPGTRVRITAEPMEASR